MAGSSCHISIITFFPTFNKPSNSIVSEERVKGRSTSLMASLKCDSSDQKIGLMLLASRASMVYVKRVDSGVMVWGISLTEMIPRGTVVSSCQVTGETVGDDVGTSGAIEPPLEKATSLKCATGPLVSLSKRAVPVPLLEPTAMAMVISGCNTNSCISFVTAENVQAESS